MFRPLRRKARQISNEEAKRLLVKERRGVLAVNGDDGYPFALPINYYFDSAANKIYFHGAKEGYKVDALKRCDKVCFTVMGNEHTVEGEKWAPFMQSVVAFGRCVLIDDKDEAADKVRIMALKYYPRAEEVDRILACSSQGMLLYEITIEHLTGKQIQEK